MDFKKEVIDLNKERLAKQDIVCEPVVRRTEDLLEDYCKEMEDIVLKIRNLCIELDLKRDIVEECDE